MKTNSVDFFSESPYHLPHGVEAPVLVVCPLQTPENYGSIIRLADSIGCPRLYLLEGPYPVSERKIRKTAGESYHRMNLVYLTEDELASLLPEAFTMVGLETAEGSQNIFTANWPKKLALVIGSEKHGIPVHLLKRCGMHVHIPLTGQCTSLNVTHAVAVALFEWLRTILK